MGWAAAVAGVIACIILAALVAASQGLGSLLLIPVIIAAVIAPTVMWIRGVSALLATRRRPESWTRGDTTSLIAGLIGAALGLLIWARIFLLVIRIGEAVI